jgi:hypothetical protein
MSTIYDHQVLQVPETIDELIVLLQQKYAEGWELNSLQLVKIAVVENQPPDS